MFSVCLLWGHVHMSHTQVRSLKTTNHQLLLSLDAEATSFSLPLSFLSASLSI